jgi:hypothetical protein
LLADGSLDRYKARWVLRGFTQWPGIDYDETFSPVVKPATVRVVLSLALSQNWLIHQLDVKNAFFAWYSHRDSVSRTTHWFCGFFSPRFFCRLNKSLYGLKQAPRAWHHKFTSHLVSLGFVEAKSDTSLFIYRRGLDTAYLLLYVDDIVITVSSSGFLKHVIETPARVCHDRHGSTTSLSGHFYDTLCRWLVPFSVAVQLGNFGARRDECVQVVQHAC